ncbi:MAG: RecQ family ATP-dependent DNA helicase [Flavobacteriaceae bacterium TMED81]|nr:MAG: RecQ family ATP-dependent DNA helicase [Flavobacteriaceae bacterium TMED81]
MSSAREHLQKHWGWSDFRPGQKEVIDASLSRKNTLVVLPTGGGKSLCFQLTALLQDGICVVVSPLVALMIDQVSALKSKNIRAMSIHGSMGENDLVEALDQCAFGNIKLLYLSPERLRNPIVCERLKTLPISLLAVDEAHCISQWGHDFRPAYRQIAQFHNIINKPPVMALTATATPKVKADIIASLELEDTQLIQTSFFRPNLSYQVIRTENKLGTIRSMLKNSSGNTILYLRTRRHCETLVEQLRMEGIHARYFHGGSSNKTELIEDWQSGREPIMVATSAFGMGIDQANVRQVIHAALPESIESYYQEAGRAGRDEQPAKATIVTSARDMQVVSSQFMDSFPRADLVRQVYAKLCAYFQIAYGETPLEPLDMSFESFVDTYNFPSKKTYEVFRLFDRIGCIRWSNLVVERFRLQVLYKGKDLRNLIRKDSPLSTILNILVRLYPNITETAQSVDGSQLSKRTGVGLDQLKVHFAALEKNGYAAISSWNCDTRLFFLEPREDDHILTRAITHLDQSLETRKVQLKAVQDYVENHKQCMQALLLDYFGETGKTACEHCSTCQSTPNPAQLQSSIMAILQKKPASAKNLSKLLVTEEKTIIASLMEMLNEERIFQKDLLFYINK